MPRNPIADSGALTGTRTFPGSAAAVPVPRPVPNRNPSQTWHSAGTRGAGMGHEPDPGAIRRDRIPLAHPLPCGPRGITSVWSTRFNPKSLAKAKEFSSARLDAAILAGGQVVV